MAAEPAESDKPQPAPQGGPPPPGKGDDGGKDGNGDKPPEPRKPSPFKNPLVLAIGGVVLVAVVVGVLLFWLSARRFQGTDDAFVDVQIVRVAPQIAGQ